LAFLFSRYSQHNNSTTFLDLPKKYK